MSTVDLGIEHLSDAVVIGRGGFATVYAATNDLLGTRVAVKVLAPLVDEADRRRFERECRVMGRVSTHPSVVTVHHAAYSAEGRPYLVMELVEGGSLADRVRADGPMRWEQAVDHAIAVAEALAHAHAAGILHRDVKPENILLADGRSRLTDFGIASLRDATGATSTSISASWLHAPPETFANRRDERSDLYSLASTLYQLVAERAPFWRAGDDSLNPLLYRLMNEPAPSLPPGSAPPVLDAFLQRGLAKDPDDRPPSAAACVAELRAIRAVVGPDGLATVAAPAETAPPEESVPPVVSAPVPTALAATVVAPADPGMIPSATVVAPADTMVAPVGPVAVPTDGAGANGGGGGPVASPRPGRRRGLLLAGLGVLAALAVAAAVLVATTGGDGDSPFQQAADGVLVFTGHRDGVLGLARLPDGRLVSSSNDGTVQLWSPDRTDEGAVVFAGHDNWVRSVAVLDDHRFVSASEDATARVWDTGQSGEAVTVFGDHGAPVATVAALADGTVASGGEDGTVQVWDPDSGAVAAALDVGGAVRAVAGLDGGGLLAAGTGGAVERWDDVSADEPAASYEAHAGSVNALAVGTDGRFVSVGDDGLVRLWSLDGGPEPVAEYQNDEPVDSVAARHDGSIVFGDRSGSVVVWYPDTGEATTAAELGSRVRSMLALPDGRVAAGAANDVRIWTP